ncbi:MAG: efflux RND transporter periplasmic adaptor subunit, partial [bacterium]
VDLRPGMSCTVDIEVEKRNDVLCVPIQSVTTREEMKGEGMMGGNENLSRESDVKQTKKMKPRELVFIIDSSMAKKEGVKTGISDDTYIEIVEGVQEGQEVVKGSFKAINKELEEGTKVKVDNEIKKPNFNKEG